MGSDKQEGPGWWQADDGRWYPPELHPDYSRLVDQTRQQTAAAETFSPPASEGAALFNPNRRRFSPYAVLSVVASASGLWLLLAFGARLALAFIVAGFFLMLRSYKWTNDGNGGRAMARVALACFVVAVAVPAVAVGRAALTVATTPVMWDLDVGECIKYEFSGPEDEAGNRDYERFDVVDCGSEHDDEIFAVVDMEIDQADRSAATSTENPTSYWDDLAESMCSQHLDHPAIRSAPDDVGVGFTRWPFEDVHNFPKTSEGYGTVICTLGTMDGGPKRGSILAGS